MFRKKEIHPDHKYPSSLWRIVKGPTESYRFTFLDLSSGKVKSNMIKE